MTASVPTLLFDRLAKVCTRFGSNFEGERSAAAYLADSLVKDAGLTWPEVILDSQAVQTRGRVWREPGTPQEAAAACLAFPECLTEWEQKFCASVAGRLRFTMKQMAVLDRLTGKVRVFAEANGETSQ